jgi:hypothetical protein
MSKKVKVDSLPNCAICESRGRDVPARYDAKTVMGPWSHLCEAHFSEYGMGLGTSFGQELILSDDEDAVAMIEDAVRIIEATNEEAHELIHDAATEADIQANTAAKRMETYPPWIQTLMSLGIEAGEYFGFESKSRNYRWVQVNGRFELHYEFSLDRRGHVTYRQANPMLDINWTTQEPDFLDESEIYENRRVLNYT